MYVIKEDNTKVGFYIYCKYYYIPRVDLQTWTGFGSQLPDALLTIATVAVMLYTSHTKSTLAPSIVLL